MNSIFAQADRKIRGNGANLTSIPQDWRAISFVKPAVHVTSEEGHFWGKHEAFEDDT